MDTFDQIEACGVVAVMRGADPDTVVDAAQALHDGGVTALELTMDADDATEMLSTVTDAFGDHVTVGAGTVLDEATATAAIHAGAEFVVSPTYDSDVVRACNRYGTLVAPGVFTPTEALEAYQAGADLVKLFPAKSVGPAHLASIRGPMPQIPIMPTGGVGLDNAADYIEAGAMAVGVGSALVDFDAVEAGHADQLTETARQFVDVIETARES